MILWQRDVRVEDGATDRRGGSTGRVTDPRWGRGQLTRDGGRLLLAGGALAVAGVGHLEDGRGRHGAGTTRVVVDGLHADHHGLTDSTALTGDGAAATQAAALQGEERVRGGERGGLRGEGRGEGRVKGGLTDSTALMGDGAAATQAAALQGEERVRGGERGGLRGEGRGEGKVKGGLTDSTALSRLRPYWERRGLGQGKGRGKGEDIHQAILAILVWI